MKETFRLDDKRSVDITVDEFDYAVAVTDTEDGKLVGEMEFRLIEGPGDGLGDELKLTSAYLDKSGPEYKGQGIGRRCLQLVRAASGLEITADEFDGQRQDDGSHLTGDAPGFVATMREEGLIS